MNNWRLCGIACAVIAAMLAGCAGAPTAGPGAPEPMPAAQTTAAGYERNQKERALSMARQGRLADAALSWEILTVLRPEVREYRERLAETRSQIVAQVAERMQRASQAQKRGELDGATQLYLSVLALQPDEPRAAEALRALERDRNKRNYLGKLSALTLTRRAVADGEMASGSAGSSNDLEHAALLAGQGELDAAIQMLERTVAGDRRDSRARQMLADFYAQKAENIAPRDKQGAVSLLQKSLRMDGSNVRAQALLRQLKPEAGGAVKSEAASPGAR